MRLSLLHLLTNSKIPAHICQKSYQSQLSVGMRQLEYRKNNDDDDDDDLTNKCEKKFNKNNCGNDRKRRVLLLRSVIIMNLRSLRRLEQIKA